MSRRHPIVGRATGTVLVLLSVLGLVGAGCSSEDAAAPGPASTTAAADAVTTASAPADGCDAGDPAPVETSPVKGVPSDLTVTSFDGTEIRAHWFPTDGAADEPAPTVLMGPGWSLPGDTSVEGASLFGALSIGGLRDAGYNVLTWDPRGFGESDGVVSVNAPDVEGRDTRILLDWVAEQPEALTDALGDPRVGMVGFSYGGGIQTVVAATDCRVDAIVPGLAWHSLETSLYKAETVKSGWSQLLVSAAAGADLDPHITSAAASGLAAGTLAPEDEQWFRERGPGDLVEDITAPALFVQGTVDTLFTLDEAITMEAILRANGVPTAMVWFCGGHGTCLTEAGDTDTVTTASFAWLDRWVKGDEDIDTGPAVDIVDQDGDRWVADEYPAGPDGGVCASAGPEGKTLALTAEGGSGPVTAGIDPSDPLGGAVAGITPAAATNAIELRVGAEEAPSALVVGAPHLTITYSGTTPDGPEPTRLFAQLVDDETGTVVGNQVTPIAVTLDGTEQTAEVDLEVIAQDMSGGRTVTLQVVATTVAYATPRLGGTVDVSAMEICLPTSGAFTEG